MNKTRIDSELTLDSNELIVALQQRNLVYNHNFLYFSNKQGNEYNHPDGWVYADSGSGGSITLESDMCKIFMASDNASMTFKQALHEFPRWQSVLIGKTVTVCAKMVLKTGCEVKVSLMDGVNQISRSATANTQKEFVFIFDLDVSQNATELTFQIESMTKGSFISVSAVFANIGTVPLENLPCMVDGVIGQRKQYPATENPPAQELSICDEAIELGLGYTRLNSVLNLRFGKGSNGYSKLPDVRGLFSRSWNNGSTADTDANDREMLGNSGVIGDLVGTAEEDIFKSHLHELKFKPTAISVAQGSPAFGLDQGSTSTSKETGEGETRPKNFAELYTIKWA